MFYINKEKNSLVITEEDFDINYNYLPEMFDIFRQMDPKKPIEVVIDLEKTPILFVLYFRKLMQESETLYNIYYREDSEPLKTALIGYDMPYKNIKERPTNKE